MTYVSIGKVAAALGVSSSYVRTLTEEGILTAERTSGGHRRYDLTTAIAAWRAHQAATWGTATNDAPPAGAALVTDGPRHGVARLAMSYPVPGPDENDVWNEVLPNLDLADGSPAAHILVYAFTEMFNNAIDHSDTDRIDVRAWRSASVVRFQVEDRGVGVFERLRSGMDLPDHRTALLELTKGKQTTDPTRHSGEGIFFTSKAVDIFRLEANGLMWVVDNVRGDEAFGASDIRRGTSVTFELEVNTARRLVDVFDAYTIDFEFARSRQVVKLHAIGVEFVSRSEAKRLLAGMDQFREVIVDFAGVHMVGQGFVDELVRVWPNAHPETALRPINMIDEIEFMVRRGQKHEGAP